MLSRAVILQNVLWFVASLVLAFFVWMIATTQNDPIAQRPFANIPVQVEIDENLIVVNQADIQPIRVLVRARQSVLNVLTTSDITARADLRGFVPGIYTVELQVRVSRLAAPDPIPRQYTIEIAQRQARQKEIVVDVTTGPPTGFTFDPEQIILSDTQAIVSGTDEQVNMVDHLAAEVDLSEQRSDYAADVLLRPMDAAGRPVTGVDLAQNTVNVTVPIVEVPGEFEITIVPDIDYASIPSGYRARLETFSPERLSASVPPEMGDERPNVIYTERIDLSDRTEDFTTFARLASIDGVTVLNAQPIEVSIAIDANTDQRTYDSVPIEFLSQNPEYENATEAIPSQVTVVVSGPQPVLDTLTLRDISAVVDMTGLGPGRYDRPVVVTINLPEIAPEDIRVLPATVGIIIGERQATPSATAGTSTTTPITPTSTP